MAAVQGWTFIEEMIFAGDFWIEKLGSKDTLFDNRAKNNNKHPNSAKYLHE